MDLVDTHCHIHSVDYGVKPDEVIESAKEAGVSRLICVGQDPKDSALAVEFVKNRPNIWATIGIHPHESSKYIKNQIILDEFEQLADGAKIVAIGECGLDYYYNHSPKRDQIKILEFQLELAKKKKLPVVFHVREAFDDFWPIIDNFPGLTGVIHSFTADIETMNKAVNHGLLLGLNGIVTFAKSETISDMLKQIDLQNLLLETDAPYLTPTPYRGTICEPKHVRVTAEFIAERRKDDLFVVAEQTTRNAKNLFNIK